MSMAYTGAAGATGLIEKYLGSDPDVIWQLVQDLQNLENIQQVINTVEQLGEIDLSKHKLNSATFDENTGILTLTSVDETDTPIVPTVTVDLSVLLNPEIPEPTPSLIVSSDGTSVLTETPPAEPGQPSPGAQPVAPTDLNFTGDGVSVADDGDGTVTVTIPGAQAQAGSGTSISQDGVLVPTPPDLPGGGEHTPIIPTNINFTGAGVTVTDDGDNTITISISGAAAEVIGTGPLVASRRPIVEKTINSQVLAAEEGYAIHCNDPGDLTVTVPLEATESIPVGAEYEYVRMGVGAVTLQAEAGVTLNGIDGGQTSILLRHASAVLRKIATNGWLVLGAVATVALPFEVTTFLWADVFTDHSATAVYGDNDPGQDWTGWGTTELQPIQEPLEWFLNNVVPIQAPEGAYLDLNSPTGEMWLTDRFTPPPNNLIKNFTIDLVGQKILRGVNGGGDGRAGVMHFWGEKLTDPAMENVATIGFDSLQGESVLRLQKGDADTTALLNAAAPGSIVEVRTDATSANYHPTSSRETFYVASVDLVNEEIHTTAPITLVNGVPQSNPVNPAFETSDPSTVTLLQGSLLSADAASGSRTIVLANVLGLKPGDWLLVSTGETSEFGKNQWTDGVVNTDPDYPDHMKVIDAGSHVAINEELHEIQSISANVVTLRRPLGKNKLMAWGAQATKVAPIEGVTVIGGQFVGGVDFGLEAWEHQYFWCRYCVKSKFLDTEFDTDPSLGLGFRRNGQAIRFDTGDNNLIDNITIGTPQDITAGRGYGISMRLGERNSVIRNSYMEDCRHSIEFWGTSGGCRAEFNHTHNTTSSCIDTHGNWNVDITIQENLITRDGSTANLSPDLGVIPGEGDSSPDAIRIGNNKFIFDENIKVLNNVIGGPGGRFDGNALSIVPGVHNVYVDGLDVNNVQRIINFKENQRHADLTTWHVTVRNLTANHWRDKMINIEQGAGTYIMKHVLFENWVLGNVMGADPLNSLDGDGNIDGLLLSGLEDATLRNLEFHDASAGSVFSLVMDQVDGVVFEDVVFHGGSRGLDLNGNALNLSGTIQFRDLTEGFLIDRMGTNSGALTVQTNQVPAANNNLGANEVRVQEDPADPLVITVEQVA